MKKTIFIITLTICAGSITHAQFLQKLKSKTVTAADAAKDRAGDKTVDKAVTQTSDKATDKILDKTSEKINSIFKKKNKKKAETQQIPNSGTDTTAIITNGELKPIDSTRKEK